MMIETQVQADQINRDGTIGPDRAANGHLMMWNVLFPKDASGEERYYRVGDRIRYTQWDAWCAENCHHDAPPEDW